MTPRIAAVVLAYNEAKMLEHTLPAMKACVDQIVVVDMGSSDGSSAVYDKWLGEGDMLVSYEQRFLAMFGFAHARNYGAKFAKADWIFSIDADEWIDPDTSALLHEDVANGYDVLEVARRNHLRGAEQPRDLDLAAITLGTEFLAEGQRRIYRNLPRLRWEGMIHEEIHDAQGSMWQRTGPSRVILHHLNQFKTHSEDVGKSHLYAFLMLRAMQTPGLRYGTNPDWFAHYVPEHLSMLLAQANAFAGENGFAALDREALEAQLEPRGEPGAAAVRPGLLQDRNRSADAASQVSSPSPGEWLVQAAQANGTADLHGMRLDLDARASTLVVSCSGIVPNKVIYAMENSARAIPTHKLFLCDPDSLWYYKGIAGVAETHEAVVAAVDAVLAALQPRRTVAVGTSGGGYMAILLASRLKIDTCLALSPQTNLRPEWRAAAGDDRWPDLMQAIELARPDTRRDLVEELRDAAHLREIFIVYPSADELDVVHARRLQDFTNVRCFHVETDDHNVSRALQSRGKLQPILEAAVQSDTALSALLQTI